jgi:hypothetical protein
MTAKKGTKKASKPSATKSASATKSPTSAGQEPLKVQLVDEPAGDHTRLATADAEKDMRREAISPKARKEALAAGKKDPLEKWGDPDQAPDPLRRAVLGA